MKFHHRTRLGCACGSLTGLPTMVALWNLLGLGSWSSLYTWRATSAGVFVVPATALLIQSTQAAAQLQSRRPLQTAPRPLPRRGSYLPDRGSFTTVLD